MASGRPGTVAAAPCTSLDWPSQVRHRRTALGDDRVDLLLRPPVARLRGLDFKGGIALIDAGYRYAAEELSKSGLAKQFMT
jgi:hypothetical protein